MTEPLLILLTATLAVTLGVAAALWVVGELWRRSEDDDQYPN
jgi:hypothetical protein